MRDVLFGDVDYPWLDDASRKRLAECRVAARFAGMDRTFRDNEDGTVTVWPWLGTVQFDTLRRVLDRIGVVLYSMDPFCITLQCESPDSLALDIEEFLIGRPLSALMRADDVLFFGKYDNFVPEVLLRKQFAADRLDTTFELP
jgi:ATP-dependent Lhr-like helicase